MSSSRFPSRRILVALGALALAPVAGAQAQKSTQPSTSSAASNAAGVVEKVASPELVGLLTKQTGATPKQAEGGAGAIFSYAKSKLKADDFGKVSKAVPEMDGLLKAAPAADTSAQGSGGTLGALSGVASQLGGSAGTAAALAPAFQKLGLSGETVGKFVPVVLDYVTKKGGSSVGNLLGGVLK